MENLLGHKKLRPQKKCKSCKFEKKLCAYGTISKKKDKKDNICLDCRRDERMFKKIAKEEDKNKQFEFKLKTPNPLFQEYSCSMRGFFRTFKYMLKEKFDNETFIKEFVKFLQNINMDQSYIVDFELNIGYENKDGVHFSVPFRLKNKRLFPQGNNKYFNSKTNIM